jgi:hypothetical protein
MVGRVESWPSCGDRVQSVQLVVAGFRVVDAAQQAFDTGQVGFGGE